MKQFAKDKLKRWVRVILHTKDSPERTSIAFALGVFISFLPPVPWFHTIFGLILAFLFRLNRLAVLAGTYVNTPFTIAPLLVLELSLGLGLTGGNGDAPELHLRQFLSAQGWKDAFQELYPYLEPLMLGSVILGLIGAGIAYLVSLSLIRIYRRKVTAAAAEAATAAASVVAHAAAAATAVAHVATHAAEAAAKAAAKARAEAAAEADAESAPHPPIPGARPGEDAGAGDGPSGSPVSPKTAPLARVDAPETHSKA